MSDQSWMLIAQTVGLVALAVFVKSRRVSPPEFDRWLFRRMKNDPAITMEDAFSEYIQKFGIASGEERGEPALIAGAKVRLRLIEEYRLDDIFVENAIFSNYKRELRKTVNLLPEAVYLN